MTNELEVGLTHLGCSRGGERTTLVSTISAGHVFPYDDVPGLEVVGVAQTRLSPLFGQRLVAPGFGLQAEGSAVLTVLAP